MSTDSSLSGKFRWQTQIKDHSGHRQQDQIDTGDKDRCQGLEEGSSENYLGGEPCSLTLAIFCQDS
jgi:hypothetical protein